MQTICLQLYGSILRVAVAELVSMQVFRISHGRFRGLVGVVCEDDTAEIFQHAKSLAQDLLGLASSDLPVSHPEDIQDYLRAAGYGEYPWHYLETRGAFGLGLGSNQRKCSRAAFLALALGKASQLHSGPEILGDILYSLSQATDLRAPTKNTWELPQSAVPQSETLPDFEKAFEDAWIDCQEWLYGFDLNSMPRIFDMKHLGVLRQNHCCIPRKKAHNILMAARGLMMTEMQTSRKDVLHKSLFGRPWQAIVAGTSDKITMDLVGPGIQEFRLEMRRNELCPYTHDPMAVFVALQEDGRKVIYHPHARKDEPLKFEDETGERSQEPPTKDEIVRAFRLATDWSVRQRWTAFQFGVFQRILKRFKRRFRPAGFHFTDFQLGNRVQAWELAPSLKKDFLEFLQTGAQHSTSGSSESESDDGFTLTNAPEGATGWSEAETQSAARAASDDSTRWDGNSSSWWTGWQTSSSWRSEWTDWTGSWQGSGWDTHSWHSWEDQEDEDLSTLHQEALSNLGFDDGNINMQSLMLKEFLCLSGSGHMLRSLDPARDETAVETYAQWITEIEVSALRYSHDNISRKFLHGEHKGMGVETLAKDLWYERLRTTDVKPLVAVMWKGGVWVICGNRRCHAMKLYVQWLQTQGMTAMPKARVILHDFPKLSGIRDDEVRWAFVLKAVSSMSTRNQGRQVEIGRTFR